MMQPCRYTGQLIVKFESSIPRKDMCEMQAASAAIANFVIQSFQLKKSKQL